MPDVPVEVFKRVMSLGAQIDHQNLSWVAFAQVPINILDAVPVVALHPSGWEPHGNNVRGNVRQILKCANPLLKMYKHTTCLSVLPGCSPR